MDRIELQPRKPVPAQPQREVKQPVTDVARRTGWLVEKDLEDFYSDVPCTD
jgi:hypothetical protein